jgi:hypothetical protein
VPSRDRQVLSLERLFLVIMPVRVRRSM